MRTCAKQRINKGTGIWGKRWTQAQRGRGVSGVRNWVGLAGGVERDGEGQVSVGWGQEGSSRHLHPGGSIPGPWLSDLAPWECALPPGRGFPHICLTPWCPLVMTWECGAALGQVFLSREFGPVWHVVHPGVFSVGCLGKEIREECVCVGDGWEQLEIGRNVGGDGGKAECLPGRGSGYR